MKACAMACLDDDIFSTPRKRPRPQDEVSPDEPKTRRIEITHEERAELQRLVSMGAGKPGNTSGRVWEETLNCHICRREQHVVDWQYRLGGPAKKISRKAVGSFCNCCVKSCAALRVTRSLEVLTKVPSVLEKIRTLSLQKAPAKCQCTQCGGKI